MRPDVNEALRYAGIRGEAPAELRREAEALAGRLERELRPRWVWRAFSLRWEDGTPVLAEADIALPGGSARKMLAECGQAVLLACTVGAEFDAMLRAGQARDMARALLLDGCGSALAEAACDAAEREIAARFPGRFLTDRFSPGYGDLPLALQRELCAALDTPRRLGVHVTGSLLLNPVKSVTAVIGLSDRPQPARIRGCMFCGLRESCRLRKGGDTCAV